MDIDRAKMIAINYVSNSNLEPCAFRSIRFVDHNETAEVCSVGDKWIVLFDFEQLEDYVDSVTACIVVVDDATGEVSTIDSL